MRRCILLGLRVEELDGIFVDGVDDVTGRDRGIVDSRKLWQFYRMPFRLRLEKLLQISIVMHQIFVLMMRTSCDRDFLLSPSLRWSFLSFRAPSLVPFFALIRLLSGEGFVKPSLVSAWVRFFPI